VADEDGDEPSRELGYRAWRNERRKDQRRSHNALVSKIHSLLPPTARVHTARKQGAGARGLGAGGRSLHQALEDVVGYLRNLRAAGPMLPPALQQPRPQPAFSHREALLSSRSMFVLEVESNVRWTIKTLGRGAADFFAHAPWGDTEGQSLANLVRCEDVPSLVQMWNPHAHAHAVSAGGGGAVACRLHIITFSRSARTQAAGGGLPFAGGLADDVCDSGGVGDDSAGALSEVPWQYTPVLVHQLIPILPSSRSSSASSDSEGSNARQMPRALLIASLGAPCAVFSMPECTMCNSLCCFRTEIATPLEIAVPVHEPRRLVRGFQRLTGPSDKVWDQKIQRDFAWMGQAFNRVWHSGLDRENIAAMITTCPPELALVMRRVCGAMGVLISFKMQQINKAIQLQSQLSESHVELEFPPDDADYSHETADEVGIFTTFYDPQTQERRGLMMSPGIKIIADCSFDELCMRMATCDTPSPFNETEWICWILDQMLCASAGVTSLVRYHRIRGYHTGKLVRWESSLQMDAVGRVTRAKHVVTPVRVSEFDKEVRENPALVRPFQLLLGDQRRGQDLINSAIHDYEAYRFRNLQCTPEGRSFLSVMATVIDQTMSSVYAKAAQVSAMQAAMAAAQVCVFVCVSVKERGREAERARGREGETEGGGEGGRERERRRDGDCVCLRLCLRLRLCLCLRLCVFLWRLCVYFWCTSVCISGV